MIGGCVAPGRFQDGDVVGYVYAAMEPMSWKELRGPAGYIHDVAVREQSRRSGVAAELMRVAIDWLRSRGAPRVILGTAAQNEAAQKLFRRLGFRETMLEMTMELEPLAGATGFLAALHPFKVSPARNDKELVRRANEREGRPQCILEEVIHPRGHFDSGM